jgi:hypothetical protein
MSANSRASRPLTKTLGDRAVIRKDRPRQPRGSRGDGLTRDAAFRLRVVNFSRKERMKRYHVLIDPNPNPVVRHSSESCGHNSMVRRLDFFSGFESATRSHSSESSRLFGIGIDSSMQNRCVTGVNAPFHGLQPVAFFPGSSGFMPERYNAPRRLESTGRHAASS